MSSSHSCRVQAQHKKISDRAVRPSTPVRPQTEKLFRSLRSVSRSSAMSIRNSRRVERATNDVVTNAGKVLDATAAYQHDRVLLQVVPLTRNVGVDFTTIGQAHTSHLAQRRIRFLGCRGKDAQTHTAPLGRAHQVGGFRSRLLAFTSPTNELLDRRHFGVSSKLRGGTLIRIGTRTVREHTTPLCPTCGDKGGEGITSSGGTHVLPEAELRLVAYAKNRCILASFRALSTLGTSEDRAQILTRFGVRFKPRVDAQVLISNGGDPGATISPSGLTAGASDGTGSSARGSSSGPSISSSGASTWIPIWW